MEIDLNDPQSFTLENVRNLVASVDDSQIRQLRVTQKGIAFFSDDWNSTNLDGIALRFEALCQGTGYVGPKAAADDDWVRKVERALRSNWEDVKMYPGAACLFVEF